MYTDFQRIVYLDKVEGAFPELQIIPPDKGDRKSGIPLAQFCNGLIRQKRAVCVLFINQAVAGVFADQPVGFVFNPHQIGVESGKVDASVDVKFNRTS